MHGNDHGQLLAHQGLEHALHGGALPRVEARQRFIEQQDARLSGQRPRNEGTAQLSIGQIARPPSGHRRQAEVSQPMGRGPSILCGRGIGETNARMPPARHQIPNGHIQRVVGLQFRRHIADLPLPQGDRRSRGKTCALDAATQGGRQIAVQ